MNRWSRDSEEKDWEVVALTEEEFSNGTIPDDEGNCCLGGLGIDAECLIKANYFACPSAGRDECDDLVDEFHLSFPVEWSPIGRLEDEILNDRSRFRNSADCESPACGCREEETKEEERVPRMLDIVAKADGFIIGADHMKSEAAKGLCVCPALSHALAGLDSSCCTPFGGGIEEDLRIFRRDQNGPAEEFEFASELKIEETQGSKVTEESDMDADVGTGPSDRLENLQSRRAVECKCKGWWKHPLDIWGSRARQIFSFGMAAAMMGLVILGRGWYRGKCRNDNQAFRFRVYARDRRISQMMCQAARLNDAFSAVRGVPVVRAQISFGGYHDGLQ